MLLCHVKFIFPETAANLAGYFDCSWMDSIHTLPYESSFLIALNKSEWYNSQLVNPEHTIYQYNAAEEEFTTLPVNMSKPLYGEIPILVDLDMFKTCTVDRH